MRSSVMCFLILVMGLFFGVSTVSYAHDFFPYGHLKLKKQTISEEMASDFHYGGNCYGSGLRRCEYSPAQLVVSPRNPVCNQPKSQGVASIRLIDRSGLFL